MHTTGLVDVGAARLYAEVAGAGPVLMFITGASGDAGEWSEIAHVLADDFTVLTYDRRGMSRSPRPEGWTATSIAEQAGDAAGLLRTLELAPALVVGHSGGGSIACELAARHPELVAHAVIFEPPLFSAVPGGDQIAAQVRSTVEPILRERGPRQAMRAFLGAMVTDPVAEQVLGSMTQHERDRVLDNGTVFLSMELPVFTSYLPDVGRLADSGVAMTVVIGADSRGSWVEAAAQWLISRTGAARAYLPGGHVEFHAHPDEFLSLIMRVAAEADLATRAQRSSRGVAALGPADRQGRRRSSTPRREVPYGAPMAVRGGLSGRWRGARAVPVGRRPVGSVHRSLHGTLRVRARLQSDFTEPARDRSTRSAASAELHTTVHAARARMCSWSEAAGPCEAVGLVTSAARDRVTGRRVKPGRTGTAEEVIDADLVVDATGRAGRLRAARTGAGPVDPDAVRV